ncbi:MAG: carbohydrate kinase [Armatimonadetes bacterium]|nr:carbohydrate kinase [Armatimonadota bacterium]
MLSAERLAELLDGFREVRVAVLGDFFLDKYLDIDPALSELSLETGLEAYQVVGVRCQPGAAGTVTNNLSALEVGTIRALGYCGQDGEGYELRRGLHRTRVDTEHLHECAGRFTPTYTKPLVRTPGAPPRELNRLDIKNRSATPREVEDRVLASLATLADEVDAIIVGDQVQERDHGVVTTRVRKALAELGRTRPGLVIVADSREHIAQFDHVSIKPNAREAELTLGDNEDILDPGSEGFRQTARMLSMLRSDRPVFVTLGDQGVLAADGPEEPVLVPGVPVTGEIDIVGAGDSFCAGATATLAAGGTPVEAAMVGCLVASLTIQQIGTTGTATPAMVRSRLAESPYVGGARPRPQ